MHSYDPCVVCSRTPLVGESVSVAIAGGQETPICELCAEKPRAMALGAPTRRERMRSARGAATVRRTHPVVRIPHPLAQKRRVVDKAAGRA